MFAPIDADWAQRNFPNICAVFGRELSAQIETFNRVVERHVRADEDGTIVFGAMFNEGVRKPAPHRPILNSLSVLQEVELFWPTATGWLFRLEYLLGDVRASGCDPALFRDMLRSSGSYYDLIAELEWGAALRRVSGDFTAHSRTKENEEGNFDINWGIDGLRVLGDVKFFKNWLLKEKGEDALNSKLLLIKRDLNHRLNVGAAKRELGTGHAIEAALEVLQLYEAGLRGESSAEIVTEREGNEIVAHNRKDPRLIDWVRFVPSAETGPGAGSIALIESGFGDDEDQKTARGNVLKAAKQIPSPGDQDVACIFLGSSSPTDAEDVAELALGPWRFDQATGEAVRAGGGVLDPNAAEPDFEHLDAIIHFSIWTDGDVHDPLRVHLLKSAELFEKPGSLDGKKRDALQKGIAEFRKAVSFRVTPRLG